MNASPSASPKIFLSPAARAGLAVNCSPYIVRHELTGRAAVEQMVDDVRVMAANTGSVTESDLEQMGWERAQIDKHGLDARRLVAKRTAG